MRICRSHELLVAGEVGSAGQEVITMTMMIEAQLRLKLKLKPKLLIKMKIKKKTCNSDYGDLGRGHELAGGEGWFLGQKVIMTF